MGLSKEDLELKSGERGCPRETIDVSSWGGEVTVRGMTGAENGEFERLFMNSDGTPKPNQKNIREWLAVRCLVDDDGNRMYTNKDEDIKAVSQLPSAGLTQVSLKAMKLTGLDKDEAKRLTEGN